MSPRLFAIALVLATAACVSHPKPETSSGQVAIVQIDERTLGSKDARLHQYPLPPAMVQGVAEKIRQAGARVVVIDVNGLSDPTSVAIDAVGQYTGKLIEPNSVPRDDKGQLRLDAPADRVVQVRTERGALVPQHIATFAQTLSFADAYRQTAAALRPQVHDKIVYIGWTCHGCGPSVVTSQSNSYPKLFADARLADQLLQRQLAGPADN